MSAEYVKAHQTYRDLAAKAKAGDKQAHADKAKAMEDIRNIERAAARDGTILSATYEPGNKVKVQTRKAPTKRSLQEEYVRKFDSEKTVMVADRAGEQPREQTLQEFHSRRLLWR